MCDWVQSTSLGDDWSHQTFRVCVSSRAQLKARPQNYCGLHGTELYWSQEPLAFVKYYYELWCLVHVFTGSCIRSADIFIYLVPSFSSCEDTTENKTDKYTFIEISHISKYLQYYFIISYAIAVFTSEFPSGAVIKNPANGGDAGDTGSIPGSERSPGEGNSNPLHYPCLENPIERGAWWAAIHGVTKELYVIEWLSMHTH